MDAADALRSAPTAHHVAPQALIEATTKRQRAALTTRVFAADLMFSRREALLAMSEADHG